jgi:hypothetical protein
MNYKPFKRIIKISTISLLLLIGFLLLFLFVGLKIPFVQNQIGNATSKFLSKKMKTEVEIGSVAIHLFDRVALKEVYIEDLGNDTLLSLNKLVIDIDLKKLLKQKVVADKIILNTAVVNIGQNDDLKFNFQFIMDAFAPKVKKEKKKPAAPWEINIKKVEINELRTVLALKAGKQNIQLEQLKVDVKSIDLKNLIFDVHEITLKKADYVADLRRTSPSKPREKPYDPSIFPLKSLPIVVKCRKLTILKSDVDILTKDVNKPSNLFNPSHIVADNLSLSFRDVIVDSSQVLVDVRSMSTYFGDYIDIKTMKGKLKFAENETSANKLHLKTGQSNAKLDAVMEYNNFGDFIKLNDEVNLVLNTNDMVIHPAEVNYFAPFLQKFANFNGLPDPSIYAKINLSGSINDLDIQELNIKNGISHVDLTGNVQNVLKGVNDLNFENIQLSSTTSSNDLKRFLGKTKLPLDLSTFGQFNTQAALSGNLQSLDIQKLILLTESKTSIDLKGSIRNLNDTKQLRYDLEVAKVATGTKDLKTLAKGLPEMLYRLDNISYSGMIKGGITDYQLRGILNTNLGSIEPNLYANFNDKFTDATYKGAINIDNFDIGKLLNNKDLGEVTLIAVLDGEGLNLDSLNTFADVCIYSVFYKGYEYKDIELDGLVDDRYFDGSLSIKDENIALNFDGAVGFTEQVPNFDFTATVDTINLHALGLLKDTLGLKFGINAALNGNSINSMQGDIVLKDIFLNNQKYVWSTDSISINAIQLEDSVNQINILAEFLEGKITGDYEVNQLYASLIKTVDEYFPISNLFGSADSIKNSPIPTNPQQFDAEFFISDITDLARLFTDDLTEFDTASILLYFDSELDQIDMEIQAPKIVFGDIIIQNALVSTNTSDGYLSTVIVTDSIKVGKTISIPGAEINGAFSEGEGIYSFYILDEIGGKSLGTKGTLNSTDETIELKVNPSFLLAGLDWQLETQGEFKIGKGFFEFPSFNLINGDQAILMRKNTNGDINLLFESFEISQLTQYFLDTTTNIAGSITGSLDIKSSAEPLLIDGDLYFAALEFNEIELGNAMINFQNQGSNTNAIVELSDQYTSVFAEVKLSEGNAIKGTLDIQEFDIKAIQPFISNLISDAKGGLTGSLNIDGTLKKPMLNGALKLEDISTKVNSLGTYYTISKGNLDFDNNEIKTNITFLDDLKRTALLKGSIYHQYFSDFTFNLNLNTTGFTFLNAEKQPDIPFYGVLNAELDTDIKGNLKRPEIFAVFSTIENTDITIASLSNKNKLSNESYVIFADGKNYNSFQLDSLANELYKIDASFDLTLYANINDEADIKVIIDPISGDYLQVTGNGNLVLDIKESGQLLVNGTYEVSSGQYRFSYQDLFLKWPFEIFSGSEIVFSGDIMDAILDITAAYRLKATTYGLVENEFSTLSEAEKKSAKSLSDIDVVLKLEGPLLEPSVKFNIDIPENNSTAVSSSVIRALENLKTNETELNKQVFSLLLLQGFSTSNITSNIASAGTQVAYNSVSSFINSQLKKLTSKANGLEVGIGLASNSELTDEANTTNTNIAAYVRQSILNDRIIIGLGGNLDLESGNTSGGLTNVAGDFVLEYKITSDGRLRLSVFQKSDYDILNDNNVWKSGAGFSYQTTFGRLINSKNKKTPPPEPEKQKLDIDAIIKPESESEE